MGLLDLFCVVYVFFVLGKGIIEIFVEIAAASICKFSIIFDKLLCPDFLLVELLAQLLTQCFRFQD